MTTKEAIDNLKEAFKNNPNFRYTYQSNIAMAFYDEMDRRGLITAVKDNIFVINKMNAFDGKPPITENVVHEIANKAAGNFLNLWMNETKSH